MASVHRRGKYWSARIYLHGQDKWQSLRLPVASVSRRDAQKEADKLEARLKARPLPGKAVSWDAAIQQYWAAHKPKDEAKRDTGYGRWCKCSQWLAWLLSPKVNEPEVPDDAETCRQLVRRYLAERMRSVSAATVNNDRRYLSHLFNWLIREGLAAWSHNPASGKLHALPRTDQRTPDTCSPADDGALRRALQGNPSLCMLRLLMRFAGLRTSEALRARPEDLDTSRWMLTIRGTKTHTDRLVPIGRGLRRILSAWLADHRTEYFAPSPTGTQWDRDNALKAYRAACRRAGLPKRLWRSYILRKTCITRALQRGMPLQVAARVFGHSVAVMLRHYAHVQTTDAGKYL